MGRDGTGRDRQDKAGPNGASVEIVTRPTTVISHMKRLIMTQSNTRFPLSPVTFTFYVFQTVCMHDVGTTWYSRSILQLDPGQGVKILMLRGTTVVISRFGRLISRWMWGETGWGPEVEILNGRGGVRWDGIGHGD